MKEDFRYTVKNGEVTITGYTGIAENVEIPGRIDGLPVTAIGKKAFCDKQLTSVSIPDSVVAIQSEAFSQNQLTGISIPGSVTAIGAGAFARNPLTSIAIPACVDLACLITFGDAAIADDPFPGNFANFYAQGGKAAGMYTSSDREMWKRQ
jgi:hypothetical protein